MSLLSGPYNYVPLWYPRGPCYGLFFQTSGGYCFRLIANVPLKLGECLPWGSIREIRSRHALGRFMQIALIFGEHFLPRVASGGTADCVAGVVRRLFVYGGGLLW